MTIEVLKPGLMTTIQDLGRVGYQYAGVSVSGAMDQFALRAANLLLGNEESAPALEITYSGAEFKMIDHAWICICGADLGAEADHEAIPLWRPVAVKAGTVLRFRHMKMGCRAYLAVKGGFSAKRIMGSSSTDLRAKIGGMGGRTLNKGDLLQVEKMKDSDQEKWKDIIRNVHSASCFAACSWFISPYALPEYREVPVIRVIRGHEADLLTTKAYQFWLTTPYQISSQSNRMGYRLQGESLPWKEQISLISEAVTAGTVQVPSDGQPIVLMADRQTTGGYPRIGQVIYVDLPVLAQAKPGDQVYFMEVSHEEAETLLIKQEEHFTWIRLAAANYWRKG